MSKNSSFSRFMAVFISYCPRFGCSRAICRAHKTRYMFENYDQKLVVFTFYGRYHELLPNVLGFKGDSQGSKDSIHDQNSSFSCFMDVFMSYCPQFWGSMGIFLARKDTIHVWELWTKTRRFRVLWAFSWAMAHNFGVPRWFVRLVTPDTCLRDITKNSPLSRFMEVFMSYCPRFWGSVGIFMDRKETMHVWELWPKTRHFHVLWPISWAIAHSFRLLGQFNDS